MTSSAGGQQHLDELVGLGGAPVALPADAPDHPARPVDEDRVGMAPHAEGHRTPPLPVDPEREADTELLGEAAHGLRVLPQIYADQLQAPRLEPLVEDRLG